MNTEKLGFGFLRVAAVSPEVVIGDTHETALNIIKSAHGCAEKGAKLIVFSELCLSGGYSNGDLLHQELIIRKSLTSLQMVTAASANINAVIVVGLPLSVRGNLYNVAAIIDHGNVVGIVPKTYLPNGGEFYERRWFGSSHDLTVKETEIFGRMVPIGTDLLFTSLDNRNIVVAIEVCEDLWTPLQPSSFAAVAGATVLVNLSASNALVGKAEYRQALVTQQSGRGIAGYIYASAGAGESTTDVVFDGHCLIAENGVLLGESPRFREEGCAVIADLDIEVCVHDRMRTTSFGQCAHDLWGRPPYRTVGVSLRETLPALGEPLFRPNDQTPFVPKGQTEQARVCKEVFDIQVTGLVRRLKRANIKKVVLGLSGGLDSTLALLVCIRAFRKLNRDLSDIHTYTMPGFGTTKGTKSNAWALAKAMGVGIEEISINKLAKQSLADVNHQGAHDITFENAQARARTFILMQKANQLGAIVIGTGNVSEGALGWCTYNGDHISHYNVNCGVPKTLVKFVVGWVAKHEATEVQRKVLKKILATVFSPELIPGKRGRSGHKTEDVIGPYVIHDFVLRHFVRYGSSPKKILYLATRAFKGSYSESEVKKWLTVFIRRFFPNQFKRSCVPDGPKVGSVSLSPRGDWRMPSDASPTEWLRELEEV